MILVFAFSLRSKFLQNQLLVLRVQDGTVQLIFRYLSRLWLNWLISGPPPVTLDGQGQLHPSGWLVIGVKHHLVPVECGPVHAPCCHSYCLG